MSKDAPNGYCGVCGAPIGDDFWDPPTFTNEPVPGRPGMVRPVLSKPIRLDPETGAMCWCPRCDFVSGYMRELGDPERTPCARWLGHDGPHVTAWGEEMV